MEEITCRRLEANYLHPFEGPTPASKPLQQPLPPFPFPFRLTIFTMSWRSQGITGSNNIPLGSRRRFGGDDTPDGSTPPLEHSMKRGRSPVRELNPDGTKKRKKRNRWGDVTENKAAG